MFARKLLSALLSFCVGGIEVSSAYLGGNRNVAPDEITRLEGKGLPKWGTYKGITRAHLPTMWNGFRHFSPHLDCGRHREQRFPIELTDEATTFPNGKAVGWDSSRFAVTG